MHTETGELSYEQLTKIDEVRKTLLGTQAGDGAWHILRLTSGSVLPEVVMSGTFWFSVVLYVITRFLASFQVFTAADLGEFRGLGTMGVLFAFLINFYVNTSINRLFDTNAQAMKLIARINNMALLLRSMLWSSPEERDSTRRILDYMCAAHTFGHIGHSAGTYTTHNLWKGVQAEFGLLTPVEEQLALCHREFGGSRYRECMCWCVAEVNDAVKKGIIPPPIASGVYGKLVDFMEAMQSIFDFKFQPIPFASEHLLVLFMQLYLPIQTVEMAMQAQILIDDNSEIARTVIIEVFGCLLAVLANVGFQGLFHVGGFIENPYGDDLTDSRVVHFCRMAVRESRGVLSATDPRTAARPGTAEREAMEGFRSDLALLGDEKDLVKTLGYRYLEERLKYMRKLQAGEQTVTDFLSDAMFDDHDDLREVPKIPPNIPQGVRLERHASSSAQRVLQMNDEFTLEHDECEEGVSVNEVLRAVQSGSHNATSTTWVQALEVSGSESIASFASSQFQSDFSKTRLERDTSSATLEMYADDGLCVEHCG